MSGEVERSWTMQSLKPKRTLVEETYDVLTDAICSGDLPPGMRLNQDEIATRLNVSRQPVNSAISILKANGLVEDTGRRSVVVTRFDPRLFQSIYEYRKVIEPFAVTLAGAAQLDDRARKQADRVLKAGHRAVERGSIRELLHADVLFHELIYGWSGNQVIEVSMRTNWHHIRRSMAEVLRDSDAVAPIWDEHDKIVERLFAGDVEGAAETMTGHIQNAYDMVRATLDQHKSVEVGAE